MIEIEDIAFENFLDENFSIVANEEKQTKEEKAQEIFPILPVRNMVMFPKVVIPITAGREKSIKLLEEAQKNGHHEIANAAKQLIEMIDKKK